MERRKTSVVIGTNDEGRPSIKVDGHEINQMVGTDVRLRYVEDDYLGHWVLHVDIVDVEPVVEVPAEIADVMEPLRQLFLKGVADRRRVKDLYGQAGGDSNARVAE